MSDEQTCGKGLAANANLPAAIGALSAATAEMLESHRKSLDLDEGEGRAEDSAYATLVEAFRDIGIACNATAERMTGYRDLPMATHDEAALMTPDAVETFARLVQSQRELMELLRTKVEQYEPMLDG
jgi:hypothetical protein